MKKTIFLLAFFLLTTNIFAQENEHLLNNRESEPVVYEIKKAVYFLASEELQGRLPSTQGDSLAVQYITNIFQKNNLKPLFSTFHQEVAFKDISSIMTNPKQAGPKTKFSRNVVGVLEGNDPILKNEYIVIGAHFDHLGLAKDGIISGSRSKETNKIHYGADDNASGVALMLDLVHKFSSRDRKRSIIFIAFACEETGLIGSRKFLEELPFNPKQIVAMFNFDMVGKLKNNSLTIGGSKTSKQSEKIIKKYAKANNLKASLSPSGMGPSDHASFYAKNIPVFYFTTGADSTYHTNYDKPELLNYKGMKKVSALAFDIVIDVANRKDRLKFKVVKESTNNGARPELKVTLGIMPDVSGSTEGIRIDMISPDKPAYKAGLQIGDVIIELNEKKVTDIYSYMNILMSLNENQTVKVKVKREGKTKTFKLKL
jgi:Zn-dependent M28 family amino/carboxypeptidase